MFHGALALVSRSLRIDARAWQHHLTRPGLMIGIYVALCFALATSNWFGAPGLRFFRSIAYVNLAFMTLLGITFFSTPISEEKEENQLGLMLMAGISPIGLLIGKSGGRLIQALLLIAVQYPFTLLAATMGGVTYYQVSGAFLGLTGYMLMLAGLGLVCSTVSSNNRRAATLMTGGIAVYAFIPLLAISYQSYFSRGMASSTPSPLFLNALDWAIATSIFHQMGTILTTGFGDPVWSWQVVSNSAIGVAAFGLAWALFGITSQQPQGEAISRGLVGRTRAHWFSAGRPWANPFAWKDFYFIAGGIPLMLVRLAFCAALYMLATLLLSHEMVTFYQVFLTLAVVIDAGRVLSRSLHDEIRGQTLSALAMLPHSRVFVIYSKFAGALLGWLPVLIVDALVTFFTPEGRSNFVWAASTSLGLCVTSYFVLIPNLSVLLSLYVRWGAVTLATAIAIGIHFGMLSTFASSNSHPVMLVVTFCLYGLCLGCHAAVIFRFRRLAELS